MNDREYWVGLNLVKGIGAVRLQALLDAFGDAASVWKAPYDALRATGLPSRVIDNLIQVRSQVDLDRIWEKIARQGIQVITWKDENYPSRLQQIDQPPPVLYVRGQLLPEDDWSVAVVGTRRVTVYGRQVAEEVAGFLAQRGITVVSGLARGTDGIAHETALRSGGRTVAVLGSGVDIIYPPDHQGLAQRIIEHGAIISDYAPGTAPDSANFPPRNRIISGLSRAVIVVEAGETSGALITAKFGAEQGREVFAVPGNIHAPQSKGTNRLIRDGARPLLEMEEILEPLNLERVIEHKQMRLLMPADELEAKILAILSDEPLHIDEIGSQSGLPIDKVSATLAFMELKGMVRQAGGMNYILIRENYSSYKVEDDA